MRKGTQHRNAFFRPSSSGLKGKTLSDIKGIAEEEYFTFRRLLKLNWRILVAKSGTVQKPAGKLIAITFSNCHQKLSTSGFKPIVLNSIVDIFQKGKG